MALIKFGLVVVDARGKLGGHVFTKSRKGATIRTKVTPANPQTPAQAIARQRLGSLSSQWNELSEEKRQGWNSATKSFQKTNIFGDIKQPAGRDLFVKLNANLLMVDQPMITDAPTPQEIPSISLSTTVFDLNPAVGIDFDGLGATAPAGQSYVFWATPVFSPGRYNFSGSYRVVATGRDYSATALLLGYIAKYGNPAEGGAVGLGVSMVNEETGQSSVMLKARALVADTTP